MNAAGIAMCFAFRRHLFSLNHKADKLEIERGDTIGYRYMLWFLCLWLKMISFLSPNKLNNKAGYYAFADRQKFSFYGHLFRVLDCIILIRSLRFAAREAIDDEMKDLFGLD